MIKVIRAESTCPQIHQGPVVGSADCGSSASCVLMSWRGSRVLVGLIGTWRRLFGSADTARGSAAKCQLEASCAVVDYAAQT